MIIDAAVHPLMPDEEYEPRLPMPWRSALGLLPTPFGRLFEAPFPEIAELESASDPERTAEVVFGERGVDAAVLTPLTRGLVPNPRHNAAIVRATNSWLHERWLAGSAADHRYFGSIRVPVTDPFAAVEEIERWAGEPRFVQIAVPLRAFAQYGEEQYFPIWEAAAERGLPVYVQDDLATAAEYVRSPVGQPVHFAEDDALRSMLSIVHLASLITNGVLDRLPALRFIFGDGGLDLSVALLWRLDKDWRSGRIETPWVTEPPSAVAARHARFVSQAQDGTADGERRSEELSRIAEAGTRLLFGSRHPYWDGVDPERAAGDWPEDVRARVLAGNALDVMPRLAALIGVGSPSSGPEPT